MSQGAWVVSKVLGGFFASSETVIVTLIGPVKSLRTWSSRNYRGQLFLYQNFQDTFLAIIAIILVIKIMKKTAKIVGNLVGKLRIS